jgi:hypothetical protein
VWGRQRRRERRSPPLYHPCLSPDTPACPPTQPNPTQPNRTEPNRTQPNPPPTPRVYVMFDNTVDAGKCKQMMDGRMFDDRKVGGGGAWERE